MATSDAPLNVPNVTLAVARGAANSGGALTAEARRFTLNRTFEGTVGEQTYNGDGFTGAAGRTLFDNTQKNSGLTSGKCQLIAANTPGEFGSWGGELMFPNKLAQGDEIFVKFFMRYPSGFTHYTVGEGDRVKFFRIKTSQANGSNSGYIDLYWEKESGSTTYKWIKEFVDSWTSVGDKTKFPHLFDQWIEYQLYYYLHSDPAQGVVRIWRDGVLMADFNKQTLTFADDTADFIYHFTYWNGTPTPYQDQHCWVDDYTVTSDRNQTVVDPVTGFNWIGG